MTLEYFFYIPDFVGLTPGLYYFVKFRFKHQFIFLVAVYIAIGNQATDSVTLAFTFSTTLTSTTRAWEIKVSQIECYNANRYWTIPVSGFIRCALLKSDHNKKWLSLTLKFNLQASKRLLAVLDNTDGKNYKLQFFGHNLFKPFTNPRVGFSTLLASHQKIS